MKKIRTLVLVVVLGLAILPLTSCGMSKDARAVLDIAKSIPRPEPKYSTYSGQRLVYSDIGLKLVGYDADTGQSLWRVTSDTHEANWWRRAFGMNDGVSLVLTIPEYYATKDNPDGWITWSSPDAQRAKVTMTLTEMEEYRDKLAWK